MKRPLVVFTGQGISLADKFNLVAELQKRLPALFATIPDPYHNNLDLVLSRYRDSIPDETPEDGQTRNAQHATLHKHIYQLTEHSELIRRGLDTTMQLCAILARISADRLVILFTCNVDRACRFAALENGAEWFFGHYINGATSLEAILRWVGKIKCCQRGFHYFPLHGEPDFFSTGDGGTFFATEPHIQNWNPAGQPWFSTTAEGLGPHAKSVDSTWSVPKYGYRLLCDLLQGHFGLGELCEGADFLVIGYGAGATHQRCEYPFERAIQATVVESNSLLGTWNVISHEQDHASLEWYNKNKFALFIVREPEPTCSKRIKEALNQLYSVAM